VLTGLEALSYLASGSVTVTPDNLSISGQTGVQGARALISGFLADKLGEAAQFDIDVTYDEKLDPVASLPTPEECAAEIAAIQTDRKISFEPGSANIDVNGAAIMDDIAEILKRCGDIRIEIGGHTDSQGSEGMNARLSQERADAVLNAIMARRVLTSNLTAKGYGEAKPIADNGTEEGREANRRIEFRLILPDELQDTAAAGEADAAAEEDPSEAADDAADEAEPPAEDAAPADEGEPPAEDAAPEDEESNGQD
jgi:OOP family OmpA-OmpF porin